MKFKIIQDHPVSKKQSKRSIEERIKRRLERERQKKERQREKDKLKGERQKREREKRNQRRDGKKEMREREREGREAGAYPHALVYTSFAFIQFCFLVRRSGAFFCTKEGTLTRIQRHQICNECKCLNNGLQETAADSPVEVQYKCYTYIFYARVYTHMIKISATLVYSKECE